MGVFDERAHHLKIGMFILSQKILLNERFYRQSLEKYLYRL